MNSIIEYVLNIGSHKQQFLALNDALAHTKLINQAADCVYFCRERERERVRRYETTCKYFKSSNEI